MPQRRKLGQEGPVHSAEDEDEDLRLDALKKLRILIRAAQRHSAWIEKQCGVSGAQLWIMHELRERPALRVGEVAQRLAVHQTTMSNLLEGLVRQGFVAKARDPDDQRVNRLTLTRRGRALLSKAPIPARGLLAEALAKLGKAELNSLLGGLDAMLVAVGNVDENLGVQPLPFML